MKKLNQTVSGRKLKKLKNYLNHWKNALVQKTFFLYYLYNFFSFRSISVKRLNRSFKIPGKVKDIILISISYKDIAFFLLILKNFYYFLNKLFYKSLKEQNANKFLKILGGENSLVGLIKYNKFIKKYNTNNFLQNCKYRANFSHTEKLIFRFVKNKYTYFVKKEIIIKKLENAKILITKDLLDELLLKDKSIYTKYNKFIVAQESNLLNVKNAINTSLTLKFDNLKFEPYKRSKTKNYNIFKNLTSIPKGIEVRFLKNFYTWIFVKNLFNKTIYNKLFNPYNIWLFFFNYALNYYLLSKLYFLFLNYFFYIIFQKFVQISHTLKLKKLELCYDFIKLRDNSRYHLGIRPHTFVTTFNRRVKKGFR